jgi:hypothetical protein
MEVYLMHVFKIDGTKTKYPTAGSGTLNNLHSEDSGRSTLTGIMIMDLIRKNVREFNLEWQFLTSSEISQIVNLIQKNKFFDITIHDVITNTDATNTYYMGALNHNWVSFANGDLYYHLSVNIIQK